MTEKTERIEHFLKSGEQTQVTPEIQKIADQIGGEGVVFIFNLLEWIHKNIAMKRSDFPNGLKFNDLLCQRTANQIIEDGYGAGCTDFALAFIPVARAKGIPTKYIEGIHRDWIKNPDPKHVKGHVFANCFIDGKWRTADPTSSNLNTRENYLNYVVYAKGLDSWDLGIRDLQTMREKFIPFAKEYNKRVKQSTG